MRRADFMDPALDPVRWESALDAAPDASVFQTLAWLRNWWACFGRGRLHLFEVEHAAGTTWAPFFVDGGMAFLVGAGESDYLDLPGAPLDAPTLAAVLGAVRDLEPGLLGFRLHHLAEDSPTLAALPEAAASLELESFREQEQLAPWRDLGADPAAAAGLLRKKSLRRALAGFEALAPLEVRHLRAPEQVEPLLGAFFAQHGARWAERGVASPLLTPPMQSFYRGMVRAIGVAGHLRFTAVRWRGADLAFHLGFAYRGRWMFYKPSFDLRHAALSPGQVLDHQVIAAALADGARVLDQGLGDEPYKSRYADRVRRVYDVGLYPRKSAHGAGLR
ncbi:MAG TPA: GNAT family N-acetyltransferase [Planctomycetota bacterium]